MLLITLLIDNIVCESREDYKQGYKRDGLSLFKKKKKIQASIPYTMEVGRFHTVNQSQKYYHKTQSTNIRMITKKNSNRQTHTTSPF